MTDRNPRRQRRRRGGARLSDADSHSPEAMGVGERMYGSPVRVPLTGADSTSFMPTPRVDARIGNPFLDPNQVPGLNQDAGDTSGAGEVNTAFRNTYGSFMPYNANLIMSALGSMQQGQPLPQSPLHSTPHPIPHPAVVPTPQCTPEPQATSQQSGGRTLPWSEHEVVVRDKSLIEPEGDTYLLYYPFTKYEMLLVCNSIKVRRNFEVSGAKQLKNLFAYARKLGKVPDWVSPSNWAQLQKYWEGFDFQKLSSQNKKNRSSDPEGMGPSLHTYASIPITEQCRRLATSLQREPTVDELYKDTHMRRKKDNQGNWVCKKSELRLEEHRKRWQEYRSSHSSTDDNSQSPLLPERDIWVQGNLTRKGRVYGFGAEGVVMKQWSRLSVSSRSSSVNNYDAREMAMRLNESAVKAAEDARHAEEAR
ncbi:hypothetical protein Cgig2_001670 [Carnegiea gigantea]|uniref:Uncharacterized protein n=1 Tax=Carnegiea gigantea TaxID=171969 RepID=A0A9Q1Q8W8_9CARY|nr:hypothetical protein Cgig2_001670 [Carnegiea gigantea]